jgi:hypothetical protein
LSGGLGDLESYPGAQHETSDEGHAGEEEAGFQPFEQLLLAHEPADVDGYEGESEGCDYDLVELADSVSGDESGDDPLSGYEGDWLDDVSRGVCFRLLFRVGGL